jgi:poly(glycerol-phosphate) alpha-glucosyltransferase
MIFFINESVQENKSGIEHAQNKRAKLFADHAEPFKLLYRQWQPQTHTMMSRDGFQDDQYINMFDYFQETSTVPRKQVIAEEIDFGLENLNYVDELTNRRVIVRDSRDQLVARVNYDDQMAKQVISTELFDGFGNLYRVDQYDDRGFKSLSQFYTPDNQVGNEVWLRRDGTIAVETYYRPNVKGELAKTGWRVNLKNGESHLFNHLDELTGFWFNALNHDYFSAEKPNIFVLDRSHIGDWQLKQLELPAYSVLHLHNSQAGNAQAPMTSILNNFYEYPLFNLDQYDAVISATHKQTHDVQARFKPTKAKLFTIPVGIISEAQLQETRVAMSDRIFGKVIVTARIANEKRLDHLVRAIGEARKVVPEITLDIYGYADGTNNYEARRKIEAVVHEYQLEDAVRLMGYTNDVASVQKKAQIYGLTSVMEGFNLALLEASSRGDVALTYDVNYGPNEIIVNGENGLVVPFDDWQAIVDGLVYYFTHLDELQKASDKAYELAQRYSSENVWQAWQTLLTDANKTWSDKLKMMRPIQNKATI